MNFRTASQEVARQKGTLAVYDELIHVLSKALNGSLEIPVDTDDGVVPLEQIEIVAEHIEMQRQQCMDAIARLEGLELSEGRNGRIKKK